MRRPDTTSAARSNECEMGRAEVLGTISARAPRRSAKSMVWRLRRCCPLGLGGFVTSLAATSRSAPIHKRRRHKRRLLTHRLHHILCSHTVTP